MKTSKKTDYAIHALMILAKRPNQDLSVEEIAEIENVSTSYLAKVMQKLSGAGIVSSSEGKKGGYSLAKAPKKIDLASIVKILEEDKNVFDCVDDVHGCEIRDRCKIHSIFTKAYQKMLEELSKTSLDEILEPEIKK